MVQVLEPGRVQVGQQVRVGKRRCSGGGGRGGRGRALRRPQAEVLLRLAVLVLCRGGRGGRGGVVQFERREVASSPPSNG